MTLPQAATDYYKSCPGEEQVKISNAICRGRRRASYPKCPGCQFNDDDRAGEATAASRNTPNASGLEGIFRPNNICATSQTPLTADAAWRIGHAAGQFLHGRLRGYERASPGSRSVVVGRDLRPSSKPLQQALIDGIRSVGMDVIDIGVVDTPQLYFAVNHFHACGGIQTTGGIMPAGFDGFKLCGAKGAPIGEQTGLAGIRDIAMRVPKHLTATSARLREANLSAEYSTFIRRALSCNKLGRALRVVVDAGHGVASQWLGVVWSGIENLQIEMMNGSADEPYAHDPDPCNPACTLDLRKRVKESKADFGIAFSSDADRCVFIDEKGALVSPDMIVALLGRMFLERQRGASVVLDVRAGMAAFDEIQKAGGTALRERVGYAHMRKRMADVSAILGADWSGRFYFRDAEFCESAFLACTHLMALLNSSGLRLSESVQPLMKYRSTGEVKRPCTAPEQAFARIVAAHNDVALEQLDGVAARFTDWSFNVRFMEGEAALGLVVEAKTKKLADQRLAELAAVIEL